MRAFIVLSFLIFLATSSGEAAEQLAVLYLEDDSAVAGEIQQRLEARVRAKVSGVEVRPTADMAARLAPTTAKGSGADAKKVEELLLEARKSLWAADLVGAGMRIALAESMVDAMGSFPAVDRANLVIWRAALLLANEDASGAEREVERLLTLAPDAKVDLDVFPPSFGKLVDRVRDSSPKPVLVNVRGLPKGSRFWIDNRPAAALWSVTPGSHRLHVEAPGFRSVDLPFDAKSDLSLSVSLPLAVAPAQEHKLIAFANGAELSEKERIQVWELVFRVAAGDAIFVATRADGGLRGRLFYRGMSSATSPKVPSTNEGEESLAEWAGTTLASMRSARIAAASTAKRFEQGDVWEVRGGFGFSSRIWRLDGTDSGRFTAGFSGGGPWATTRLSRHGLLAEAAASFADYGIRTESVTLGRGDDVNASGGSTLSVVLNGGYRFRFGGQGAAPSVVFLGGGSFDRHQADGLDDASGDLGLLPSWDRLALDLGVCTELPLSLIARQRPVLVSFRAAASPWSSWRTTPSDALGSSPAPAVAFSWGAAVDVGLARRWAVRFGYDAQRRAVEFDGRGRAPVDPPLMNATATEQVHAVHLSFGRDF